LYQLEIEEQARRALKRLPGHMRQRVARAIDALRYNPRPTGAKTLQHALAGYWRIRIADYRVIYTIVEEVVLVTVVKVAQRDQSTYEDLV
jgi:mRNA interferase RelE/StbE